MYLFNILCKPLVTFLKAIFGILPQVEYCKNIGITMSKMPSQAYVQVKKSKDSCGYHRYN